MTSNVCSCGKNKINITNLFSLDKNNTGDLVCVILSTFHYNESIEYHNTIILNVNTKKRSFAVLLNNDVVKTINTQETYTQILFR